MSNYPSDDNPKSSSAFEVESEEELADESFGRNKLCLDVAIDSFIIHREISILVRNHYSPWRPPQFIS